MKKILIIFIPSIVLAVILFLLLQISVLKKFDKGALQVTSDPPSKVYLNDKYIGVTPLSKNKDEDRISVGEYEIKLIPSDPNFDEFRETITITKSALTVVDRKFDKGAFAEGSNISLIPIKDDKKAQISVVTFPEGVTVELDGKSKGKTPLLIKDIAISGHSLVLKKEGYKEKTVRVQTPPGHELRAIAYLAVVTDLAQISAESTPSAVLSPAVSPTAILSNKVTILATPNGFLRVRKSASITAAEIARVNPGDILDIISEISGWYQIKLPNGGSGFISSDYAKKQ